LKPPLNAGLWKTAGVTLRLVLIGLLASVAAYEPARAQVLDGESTTADAALMLAAQRVAEAPFDRTAAYTLTYVILGDGNVAPAEEDLLRELASNDTGPVNLSGPGRAAIALGRPQNDAREVFGLILEPAPLDSLWMTGKAQMSRLGGVAYLSPATWVRIREFVARKLEPAWVESSYLNAYSPLLMALAEVEDLLVAVDEDELIARAVQGLVYEAVVLLDTNYQRATPTYVYDWLAHEPPYRPYDRVEVAAGP